jgi:hypothetical protein
LHPFLLHRYLGGIMQWIVSAYGFKKSSVAGRFAVGHDNTVKRSFFGPVTG